MGRCYRQVKFVALLMFVVLVIIYLRQELSNNNHVKNENPIVGAILQQNLIVKDVAIDTAVVDSGKPSFPPTPSLKPDMFHKKACRQQHGKVALLQLASGDNFIQSVAWNALQSMRCYARMRGYALYQFTMVGNHLKAGAPSDEMNRLDSQCEAYNSLLPKRHCLVAQLLFNYEYVVHIDADSGVVNPDHCFEEYIHQNVDLHFLLRVHSGEVQAGHYIAKNTSFARDFLMTWAKQTRDAGQFNDQPVLHDLLSSRLLSSDENELCNSVKSTGYYVWIKCILSNLQKRQQKTRKALFYARAQAFVRDGWSSQFYWSTADFMLHAMKHDNDCLFSRKLRVEECEGDVWSIPYNSKYKIVDGVNGGVGGKRMKDVWIEREQLFKKIYPHFARIGHLEECWPRCPHILA